MASRLDFPFRIAGEGRPATAGADEYVRDLIFLVLFTSPGERVNRPDFGCGLRQRLFAPNDPAAEAATRFLVQGALQRWLSEVIEVRRVVISHREERLEVEVRYRRLTDGRTVSEQFSATTV